MNTSFEVAPKPSVGKSKASKPNKTIRRPMVYRLQKRHFLFYWLIPNIGATVLLPFFFPPSSLEWTLLAVGWFATMLGVSVGFHRLFTHKAFQTFHWVESLLAVLGMMATGGSLLSWVATHRRHHERSDREGDPHSPLGNPQLYRATFTDWCAGMLHAHALWLHKHDYVNPLFYCRDLYQKRFLVNLSRHYGALS